MNRTDIKEAMREAKAGNLQPAESLMHQMLVENHRLADESLMASEELEKAKAKKKEVIYKEVKIPVTRYEKVIEKAKPTITEAASTLMYCLNELHMAKSLYLRETNKGEGFIVNPNLECKTALKAALYTFFITNCARYAKCRQSGATHEQALQLTLGRFEELLKESLTRITDALDKLNKDVDLETFCTTPVGFLKGNTAYWKAE